MRLIFYTFRDLIIRFIPKRIGNLLVKPGEFAFLVHPMDLLDFYKKYPFSKKIPKRILYFCCKHLWPIIISEITGAKNKKNNEIKGYIIGCSMTAKQMLGNRKLAEKRVIQAVKLSEKIGAKIIGLGALTSSVTQGGGSLLNKVKIAITNGNSYTAAITIEAIEKIKNLLRVRYGDLIIAIVGATGSIGKAVSVNLAKKKFKKLILIGKTIESLKFLEEEISKNTVVKTKFTNKINNIKEADLVIVATSAIGAIIKKEYVKKGSIIYDITQPRNVSPEILKEMPSLLVIDGGLVEASGINYNFDLGIPRQTMFACLAETIILASEGRFRDFSTGDVTNNRIKEISSLANKYQYKLADFRGFGEIISLKTFRQIS